ncbi:MAG: MBL fold metallo-hydrolase [Armatimonadetes bacterium]|jgi:phosphoribosyl 1,2-cyclic phosphate phosphodiesterase|nr:MBL fold metallo-hydrolase [Armatimonadota bacterium]
MRIQILGTAAAEGWPAVFCGCDTCVRARAAGGHNLRSRSSIQIDDIYKIDLPPDTFHHVLTYDINLSNLEHLFITHSHHDHFAVSELYYTRPPFAHNIRKPPIRIYGNETVADTVRTKVSEDSHPIEVVTLEAFVPVKANDLRFIPITAHHSPNEHCLNYVIESDSVRVLYASDTGEYEQPTLDFLAALDYDLLIIECTQGALPGPATSHMSFEAVLRLRDKIGPTTRTVITHFSHNMGLLHDEFEAIANPEGVEVAYDGIVLEC